MPDIPVTTGFIRLTVVANADRRDVVLPTDAPVAQLTADLRQLIGGGNGLREAPLRLARPGQADLAPNRPLREQDVRDGEVLYLVPATAAAPPPVIDDVVEAVAVRSDGTAGSLWTGRTHRATLLCGGAVFLTVTAALLPRLGSLRPVLVAAAVAALALVAGAVWLSRRADTAAAGVTASSALPWWAVAAWVLTADQALPVRIAAAATAAAVCGLAVGTALPRLAAPAGAAVGAAFSLAAAAGAVATGRVTLAQAGAVVAVAWAVITALAPAIAARLAGLLPLATEPTARPAAVLESIRRATVARHLVSWLHALGALVLAVAGAALALTGGPADRGLAAAIAVLVAVRSRRSKYRVDRLPLLAAAGVVLTALAWAVTGDSGAGPRWAVALTGLLGVGLLAGAVTWRDRPLTARVANRLDLVDNVVALSVLPLLAGSLGIFGLVDRLARG